MFSGLFKTNEAKSLWDQCAEALRKFNPNAPVEEVNRLVIYVSHSIQEAYPELIDEVLKDVINEFSDRLPEAELKKPKKKKKRS